MKTLFLATTALAIAGAGTVQAADIFICSGVGYAARDGRVELACTAPVTTHWTKLGGQSSALVYYIDAPDGLHVAVTTQHGMKERQRARPRCGSCSAAGGHLHIAEPAAGGSAQ